MADFDETEAEAIASNWVQNLRFRFARMGLNYNSESTDVRKGCDNVSDLKRKSIKVGERSSIDSNLKGEVTVSENDSFKTFQPEKNSELLLEDISSGDRCHGVLPSTRSDKSKVDLENLREKRLNFFQQNTSYTNQKDVFSKRCEFENNDSDKYVEPPSSNGMQSLSAKKNCVNEESDQESDAIGSKNQGPYIAWGSSKFNMVDPCESDTLSYKRSQAVPSTSSETHKMKAKNFDDVNTRKNCSFGGGFGDFECKDSSQVFPIELDEDISEERIKINQSEVSLGRLYYSSDSESDYTVDDPISRHVSPRIEDGQIWGHLSRDFNVMSSLAQSASPPAPQITGALYHEFDSSDKELDNDNIISENDTIKARHRPRSLSHPSTVRDCSDMYESYCCVNASNGIDVVCNVSSKKECVDVEITYGNENKDIASNGWFNSSKHCLSKENDTGNSFKNNSHQKQCIEFGKSNNNSMKNGSLQKKKTDKINEDYFDVCLCPECDEINRASASWCSECGTMLTKTNPISSKSIDLNNKTNQTGKHLSIPKTQAKIGEASKTDELQSSSVTKKSLSVPKANSQSQLTALKKTKPNGRRWEKSNLAWSTFKDSHLSKPPSTKNLKSHPRKENIAKESLEVSRPRSTSCKNTGKKMKAEDNRPGAPGSLPRSYKFKEFKKKKGNSLGHSAGNLTLEGTKPTGKKTSQIRDSSKYDEMNEKIRTNHEKPLPYLCLPDEIILRIFCYLTHADLARCSCVCRQLNRIAQDEILWRTIILTRNQNINDDFLEKIGSKKPVSLSLIKCHGNLVTSSGLRELFRRCADNLEELNFIGCNGGQLIGESILLHVALRCNKLRSVDVSWSNVGDNGVEALVQNVERLECLCLNGCQAITDHSLKVVADKHGGSLRTFEIFGCFNVSASAIKRLGQKCPSLETLNLGQCYKITSSDIGRLVSHLESIVNLDLRGCKQARDACVKTIVKHCPHLVNLVLANCPLITDVAMSEIATNLSTVRCLDVCGCVNVTDNGVRALAKSCNRLNSLDLSSTSITQKSVMLLANYCSQNLQSLKLSFCVDVTDDSVCRLVKHCKRMKILHLYGCKRLRNVKALQKLNRSLKLEF